MSKIKGLLMIIVFLLLIYTRFVNIGWGLPYPLHPDERNMAVSVQGLNCKISNFQFPISNCLNPHFFAYGQFPLYLGYLGVLGHQVLSGKLGSPISFEEAVLSLRIISAIASIINAFVLLKIIEILTPKSKVYSLKSLWLLIITFAPFFIQFSHFGTTESLLMLLFSLMVYLSLKSDNFFGLALVGGLAIATKISSLIFLAVPIAAILVGRQKKVFRSIIGLIIMTGIFSLLFSPHNFISFKEFISAIRYESDVATGRSLVFYTRQFTNSIPLIFQFTKIFPYVLGWPAFVLGVLGFLVLPWKKKEYNFLRFSLLMYLIPNAFLFAKWTRFMAPILPLMLLFAVLGLNELISNLKSQISKLQLKNQNPFKFSSIILHFAFCILIFILITPGLAYLSIYQDTDVRFTASKWFYNHIKDNSFILSETANVVDLPIYDLRQTQNVPHYNVVSFNFYDLDTDPVLQQRLKEYVGIVDYIFVPSRRIFMNHDAKDYPKLHDYYRKLFSGQLGFKKIAEFNSYPTLKFQILKFKFLIGFPDEQAEETWTVFDHPVIRIYKKV